MIVRATTDYSIRMMSFLARNDNFASSTEISEHTGIPQKYLIKISSTLRNAGLISSQQGLNGGYSLAQNATEITMWDILKVVEPDICVERTTENDNEDCSVNDGALVQLMFNGINEKLQNYFQSISLADFASNTNYKSQSKGGADNEGH